MQLFRRSALRTVSSPSTAFISKPRAITTTSPFALRSKVHSGIAPSAFRRYASDEAGSSEQKKSEIELADNEQGAVREAINSATESVGTYARDAAESLTSNAEQAKDSFVDAAAGAAAAAGLAYRPREDRRESRPYNNRYDEGQGRNSFSDRNSYNDRRGSNRAVHGAGYGGRGGDAYESKPRVSDRVLTPTNGIYIGNILFDVTSEDLKREFSEFGTITRATIASDIRGLSKGFGYIDFETVEQATAAIEAKNQAVMEGRRLIVNYQANKSSPPRTNAPSKTLFIGNLAFEMSDADLNKLFRDIRNVIDVRVAIDRRTGQPRGFAHADFTDVESATAAQKALTNQEFHGRRLRVDFSAGRQPSQAPDLDGPENGSF